MDHSDSDGEHEEVTHQKHSFFLKPLPTEDSRIYVGIVEKQVTVGMIEDWKRRCAVLTREGLSRGDVKSCFRVLKLPHSLQILQALIQNVSSMRSEDEVSWDNFKLLAQNAAWSDLTVDCIPLDQIENVKFEVKDLVESGPAVSSPKHSPSELPEPKKVIMVGLLSHRRVILQES